MTVCTLNGSSIREYELISEKTNSIILVRKLWIQLVGRMYSQIHIFSLLNSPQSKIGLLKSFWTLLTAGFAAECPRPSRAYSVLFERIVNDWT